MIKLEKIGIPSVLIATDVFTDACKTMAKLHGIPDIKWAIVPHPIGSLTEDVLMERAKSAVEQLAPISTGN